MKLFPFQGKLNKFRQDVVFETGDLGTLPRAREIIMQYKFCCQQTQLKVTPLDYNTSYANVWGSTRVIYPESSIRCMWLYSIRHALRSGPLDPGHSERHLIGHLAFLTFHRRPHDNKCPTVDRNTNVVELEAFNKNGDDSLHLREGKTVADT
jgi:hypothetical protein